jgi:hypothetical protein
MSEFTLCESINLNSYQYLPRDCLVYVRVAVSACFLSDISTALRVFPSFIYEVANYIW